MGERELRCTGRKEPGRWGCISLSMGVYALPKHTEPECDFPSSTKIQKSNYRMGFVRQKSMLLVRQVAGFLRDASGTTQSRLLSAWQARGVSESLGGRVMWVTGIPGGMAWVTERKCYLWILSRCDRKSIRLELEVWGKFVSLTFAWTNTRQVLPQKIILQKRGWFLSVTFLRSFLHYDIWFWMLTKMTNNHQKSIELLKQP